MALYYKKNSSANNVVVEGQELYKKRRDLISGFDLIYSDSRQ